MDFTSSLSSFMITGDHGCQSKSSPITDDGHQQHLEMLLAQRLARLCILDIDDTDHLSADLSTGIPVERIHGGFLIILGQTARADPSSMFNSNCPLVNEHDYYMGNGHL